MIIKIFIGIAFIERTRDTENEKCRVRSWNLAGKQGGPMDEYVHFIFRVATRYLLLLVYEFP